MKFLNIVPWAKRSAQLDQAMTCSNPVPAMPKLDQAVPCSTPVQAMACAEPSASAPSTAMAVWSDIAEKKRRRSSGHGKTWRPSLDAISENAALRTTPPAAARKEGVAKSRGKNVKMKGRVSIYTGCDDLRHFGSATMMPSFSPPAFLF